VAFRGSFSCEIVARGWLTATLRSGTTTAMLTRDPDGQARLGGMRLADVLGAAAGAGTPAYVYDLDGMAAAARELVGGSAAPRTWSPTP